MKIDGKEISKFILDDLKKRAELLKSKGIVPHLAIILIGDDPASEAYVKQKMLKAEQIGVKTTLLKLQKEINEEKLLALIGKLNNNLSIHGIIVQRPLPLRINGEAIDEAVVSQKDVDGFNPDTKFQTPLSLAVLQILERIHSMKIDPKLSFEEWLQGSTIIIIGKGKTGGEPIIQLLSDKGCYPTVLDSKTENKETILKEADIIVSAVGKKNIVTGNQIKKDAIVIGIGVYKEEDGKLHGDYEEDDIKDKVSFYTPVPGGIGPVNVAMLLENVVQAAEETL